MLTSRQHYLQLHWSDHWTILITITLPVWKRFISVYVKSTFKQKL